MARLRLLITAILCALIWLAPLSAVNADEDSSFFRAGVGFFQQGRYLEAVEQFSAAIQVRPTSAAYSNRCLSYIQLSVYDQAIADCSEAIALAPENSEAYLNRGIAAYRTGNSDAAIVDYTQLLQFQPKDYRAYYNRGLAQAEQRHYRAALQDFNAALQQVSPLDQETHAVILNDRGTVYLAMADYQVAIADFTRAIQASPLFVSATFNRGCAYHRAGNLVAALQDFDQVINLDHTFAQAYLNRGLLHHQLGQQQAAIADLEIAAEQFQQQDFLPGYRKTLEWLEKVHTHYSAYV